MRLRSKTRPLEPPGADMASQPIPEPLILALGSRRNPCAHTRSVYGKRRNAHHIGRALGSHRTRHVVEDAVAIGAAGLNRVPVDSMDRPARESRRRSSGSSSACEAGVVPHRCGASPAGRFSAPGARIAAVRLPYGRRAGSNPTHRTSG
jgi:hypothetical protein